jgi:hypothetical protein
MIEKRNGCLEMLVERSCGQQDTSLDLIRLVSMLIRCRSNEDESACMRVELLFLMLSCSRSNVVGTLIKRLFR